jgi:hypothetical protein
MQIIAFSNDYFEQKNKFKMKKQTHFQPLIFSLFFLMVFTNCTKTYIPTDSINIPVLTTVAVNIITKNSPESGGNIVSDGGATVIMYGVCWNIKHNLTTDNYKTTSGSGIGNFISSITGLVPNTTYYVRAYATNVLGTSYGNEVSFHSRE